MTRRPRDLVPALAAYYARRHPLRPAKTDFDDELLAAVDFLLAQIDPDGTRPMIYPPAYAEGAETQPSVKSTGRRSVRHVD